MSTEHMAQVTEENSTIANSRGYGKRGRRLQSETVDRGNAKRSRIEEDSENVQKNSEPNSDKVAKKTKTKGRKGPNLWKGLLTCPEGIAWLKDF